MGAIAATAPARALAGVADLGYTAGRFAGEKTGLIDPASPREPNFTPQVDRLTDVAAGRPLSQSIPRSMLEGAVTGGSTLPAVVAGGVAGGASRWAQEEGLPWWAQMGAGMAGGAVAGKATSMLGKRLPEVLAAKRLAEATEGMTPDQLRAGAKPMANARAEGVSLYPSQTLDDGRGAGLEALQGALYNTKASGGEKFRSIGREQPAAVRQLVEGLRNRSGQAPRPDDLMAEDVQKAAAAYAKSGGNAVNDATRGLYQGDQATRRFLNPNIVPRIEQHFDDLIVANRADMLAVPALKEAKKLVLDLANENRVTLGEFNKRIQQIKANLPSYTAAEPSAVNHMRGVVTDALRPLDDFIAQNAPELAQAKQMQADLRQSLPNQFSEFTKQAKASTTSSLDQAQKRPELVAELSRRAPQLTQELLQRQVNQAVDKALEGATPGATINKQLTTGEAGRQLTGNISALFANSSNPKAAVEGFNRVLEVAANASKPTGGQVAISTGQGISKHVGAQVGNLLGAPAYAAGQALLHIRDNATIDVLTRPDVMERLAYLASVPKPKLTPALILATVPQLFEERK